MKEFSFAYFSSTNSVSIDDSTMKLKIGPFIKKEFPFQNLVYYYPFRNKQYRAIYFVYTNAKGKNKNIPVYSSPHEKQFNLLLEELKAKAPKKSLEHLADDDAFKIMKISNPKKWVPVIIVLAMVFIATVCVYPGIRHFFDFGFANATVEDVGNNKDLGTRNVCITGKPYHKTEEVTQTNSRKHETTKTLYVPLVNENYVDGDPIKIILKFDEVSELDHDDAMSATNFTGVIRNIAWEGMNNSDIGFFKTNYGITFPQTPILIEVTGREHNDVYAIWVVIGMAITIVGMLVVGSQMKM